MLHPSRPLSTQNPFRNWSQNPHGLWLPPQHQTTSSSPPVPSSPQPPTPARASTLLPPNPFPLSSISSPLPTKRRKLRHDVWGIKDKTTWDWLSLLLIPLLIGLGTIWVTDRQTTAQNALSAQLHQSDHDQHTNDLKIAQQARWDDLLRTYRDGIDTLLLTYNLRYSQPGQDASEIAHSRTLDVLDAVDATRRDDVLLYLSRLHLIQTSFDDIDGKEHQQTPMVSLFWANLSGAHLPRAFLDMTDLSGADLSGADLSGAFLDRANLEETTLDKANLSGAYLFGADLSSTDLKEANLKEANLKEADLKEADLKEADLKGARVTITQLEEVYSLSGTMLPNGFICEQASHKNDLREQARITRDCLTHFNDPPKKA